MTGSGHSRRFWDVRVTSAYPPKLAVKADVLDRPFSAISRPVHDLAANAENLLLRFTNNFVGARESSFGDPIGILWIVKVLHNQIAGPSDHSFAPRRNEIERSILFSNHHKAHLYAARSIRRPAVCVRSAYWAFIPLRKGCSGNKNLFVPGFRTTIPDHHIARFCRRALRLPAFSFYHSDNDFFGLGGPHVDQLRLARQSGSSRVLCSDEVCNYINSFLSVQRAILAKDGNAQNKPFGEVLQRQAQVAGHCAFRVKEFAQFLRSRQPSLACRLSASTAGRTPTARRLGLLLTAVWTNSQKKAFSRTPTYNRLPACPLG